ncbi:MAG: hypothetical protein JHC37_00135 [Campylobacteraceae bacterium]|nr:hypothetical protein [Campylobacteraceae bacterium]
MQDNKKFDFAKAITFLLIFVGICVFSLSMLLIPAIREYKKQSDIYKIEYSLYLKAKERHDEESGKLKALKTTNAKILTALEKKTDETSLVSLAKNYFKKSEIKKAGALEKEGGFFYEDYNVTATFAAPKELFSFLKALSDDNAVVKVKTPLVMGTAGDGLISNFMLRVYYLNPPKEPKK